MTMCYMLIQLTAEFNTKKQNGCLQTQYTASYSDNLAIG